MGEPHILEAGQLLGRYRILRRIGSGAMGDVYEAEHSGLQKRCAIKVLKPQVAADPVFAERFKREGVAASKLQHFNVVDVYDIDSVEGVSFLVMEYLEGEDLASYLRRRGHLSPEEATDLLLPILDAVDSAHRKGVIHRDLKPSNIFLARDIRGEVLPKVLDFGVAKPIGQFQEPALTVTGWFVGTPGYMSPEQVQREKDLGPRSDQYQLGVIFYECLTGIHPFRDLPVHTVLFRIAEGIFVPPREIKSDLPETLEDVILRAMGQEPTQRYEDLREMAKALLPFASPSIKAQWGPALDDRVVTWTTVPKTPEVESLEAPVVRRSLVGRGRKAALLVFGGGTAAVLALAFGAGANWWRRRGSSDIETPRVSSVPLVRRFRISVEPSTASLYFDDEDPVVGELRGTFRPGQTTHRVVITAEGFVTQILTFRDNPPAEKVVLVAIGDR